MSVEIDVLKAKSEMLAYLDEENCTIDPDLASANSVEVGQQIRIKVKNSPTKYGLLTVDRTYEDGSDNNDIRLRASARTRFGQTDGFDAYLEGCDQVVLHGKDNTWLNSNDEFGELLDETDTTHTDLVICAPHGGMIENYTDEMAKWCYDKMVALSKSASCWRCIGHQDAIGAYAAWHITSTEISRSSFPYLDQIGDRGFSYAVSFHGYGEADIGVGGAAPLALKTEIKEAIENAVGTAYDVTVVTTGPYAGTSADNFVNWLTDGSDGVQIELPYGARQNYGQAIAEAVATVFAGKQ